MSAEGREVQEFGWIGWKDPRAWMEAMRGQRWQRLVEAEGRRFEAALRKAAGKEELEAAISGFEAAAEAADVAGSWTAVAPAGGGARVHILPQGSAGLEWAWVDTQQPKARLQQAGDLALAPAGIVAYTRDFGKGAESYELIAAQKGHKRLWVHRGAGGLGYGPRVAIQGGRVYILEATAPLRYSRLVSYDLRTGKGGHVLFEEAVDSPWMLDLIKGEAGCLFLIAEQAGLQRLYLVREGEVEQLCPEGVNFYPIGYGRRGGKPLYFVRRGSLDAPWTLEGEGRGTAWQIPASLLVCGIELAVASLGLVVFKQQGKRIFWMAGKGIIAAFVCEVQLNPWARWAGEGMGGELVVTVPGATPARAEVGPGGLRLAPPLQEYGGRRATGLAASADGTQVRWVLVQNANAPRSARPHGLLVAAYGAYGIPTLLETTRWKPYLERGWAVGIALVRGGGDDNEAWAEAGRREGKLRGVEDLEACVRAMQRESGVGPRATCLFGRSAGGYLVGAAVVRHPEGDLFGMAYTEVPYVDVLRTAGNPVLPLTSFEYEEFGDPARKVADFEFLLRHGPVSGLGPAGAPGVWVLCRTASNDRQVYAYESAKWAQALRGKGAAGGEEKLLRVTAGEGHFVKGVQRSIERAEDYLLLTKKVEGLSRK